MKFLFHLLFVYLFSGCWVTAEAQKLAPEYEDAIRKATNHRPQMRADFDMCLKNWGLLPIKRERLLRLLSNDQHLKEPSYILEIGSSGFSAYEFLYITGHTLRNGVGNERLLRSVEINSLNKLNELLLSDTDVAESKGELDGPCYFFTVKKGGVTKSVAIYGRLDSTPVGMEIKKLLGMSRGAPVAFEDVVIDY